MSKSVHLGSSAIVKCVKARIAIPNHFSNYFTQNNNLLLITKIIPAVWSGKSKKYPGRSKKWNKSVWSHKQVVSDLPQTVLYVSQRRPCSHWAGDGTHTFIVPEIFAHHIRLGVIRDWAGHLDLTAKQTCMWAQYIQTSNGHGYTPKWVVTHSLNQHWTHQTRHVVGPLVCADHQNTARWKVWKDDWSRELDTSQHFIMFSAADIWRNSSCTFS